MNQDSVPRFVHSLRGWLIGLVLLFAKPFNLPAQEFTIGSIEVYGNRQVQESSVINSLGLRAGDSLRADSFVMNKQNYIRRMSAVNGVQRADIAAVCCLPDGRLMIFAGIDEAQFPSFKYNNPGHAALKLPAEVTENYNQLMKVELEAAQTGNTGENDSAGHAWPTYPPATPILNKNLDFAKKYEALIRKVLRSSGDADQRAVAAELIPYVPDKKTVVNDLLYSVHDPSEDVRNNATRALAIIADFGNRKPELGIKIPAADFIDMLNSTVWTDRNKAGFVLSRLILGPDRQRILAEIKSKAVPALVQMAKWKSTGHSETFYIILGNIAGFTDQQVSEAFYSDRRDAFYVDMISRIK